MITRLTYLLRNYDDLLQKHIPELRQPENKVMKYKIRFLAKILNPLPQRGNLSRPPLR